MKKIINTADAPMAVGPYSQAVEAAGFVYVSGQIPLNPIDGTIPASVEGQTARCLDNLGAILKAAGCGFEDVVKTTVLLDDMGNFAAMNGVYASYFVKDMPARVCYQVAKLPMGVMVEIDAVAVK